jgi:hypothetical protein
MPDSLKSYFADPKKSEYDDLRMCDYDAVIFDPEEILVDYKMD